jgi:hypothetical protein
MDKTGQTLLLPVLWSIAATCNAQARAEDMNGSIPAWVRINRADLGDDSRQAGPKVQAPSLITRNLTEHSEYEPPSTSFASSRFGQLPQIDNRRLAERPASTAFPKEAYAPPSSGNRPVLEIAEGWKVFMPNIRKNVAKLLLQHSF